MKKPNLYKKIGMSGLVQAMLFLTWAIISFWLFVSNQYLAYLQPKFGILVVFSSVVFILFAVSLLFGKQHSPHHQIGSILPALILLLPIFFLFSSLDTGLGSKAFANRILDAEVKQAPDSDEFGENPEGVDAHLQESPLDQKGAVKHYTAVSISHLLMKSKQYKNRQVKAYGKLFFPENLKFADAVLYRFYITCCAADARPVGVFINGIGERKFENDVWVEVEGVYHLKKSEGDKKPILTLHSIKLITEPPIDQQYLYFPD